MSHNCFNYIVLHRCYEWQEGVIVQLATRLFSTTFIIDQSTLLCVFDIIGANAVIA